MPQRLPVHRPAHAAFADASRRKRWREVDRKRGTPQERGYTKQWAQAAKAFLGEHPMCVMCVEAGMPTPATVVDHRVPHRGDQRLFWDKGNWQPLCRSHHGQKTCSEDGGFGNRRRGA